jgi:tetratricopeptide (TPR) repeat protein
MMMTVLRIAMLLSAFLLLGEGPVLAAGGGGSAPKDANYTKAEQLIEVGNYAEAIPLLEKVVAANDKNADAFNYLGYSHRQLGQFDEALEHYQTALRLEPEHRGANEYLGEMYLQLGELEKAEERLEVLDKACFFGCEEYSELKKAIADYKARQGQS